MPPTTPVLATPRAESPVDRSPVASGSGSSHQTPVLRRRRLRLRHTRPVEQIITYPQQDSGSELEGSEDDEDIEEYDLPELYDDAHRLRAVANALQELCVIEDNVEIAGDVDHSGRGDDASRVQIAAELGDVNADFNWTNDYSSFTGVAEAYTCDPGPAYGLQEGLDIFLLIWDTDVMNTIVEETNRYAWLVIAQLSEHGSISKNLDTWYEVTVSELYRYFAILMFMAVNPRGSIKEYWSTGILGMAEFRLLMSRNRFQMISRFIHFVDNQYIPHDVRSYARKIAKIQPLVEHCNQKFQALYTPERELSLDESLLLWKGRLSWVQCIRSKAARFGIKTFELCEASTGYMLKCLIYAGKNSSMHEGPIYGFTSPTAKVVLKLMDGFLDLGHLLVMDNWYNQLLLTRYLKQRHTDVLGTLNRRRQHVPEIIKDANERRMHVGQRVSCHCGDVAVTTWKDVKLVTVLSTYHVDDMEASSRAGQDRDKPISVVHYNKYMGGVDLKDQKLSMYLLERKRGLKWYIKVFRRLLNTSLLNAYIMYCKNPMFRVLTHRQFRMKVAEDLCSRFPRDDVERPLQQPTANITRLNHALKHFPVYTEILSGIRRSKRRCARCSARQVRTQVTTMCKDCQIGLCLGRCWMEYHTLTSLE